MPELPDLETIQDFLLAELVGTTVVSVEVVHPIPLRTPAPEEFRVQLTGRRIAGIRRRGKFLLLDFAGELTLALNPMLAGRLQCCSPAERRKAKTCVILGLGNGRQLRCFDAELMGKLYLVSSAALDQIPRWGEKGPEALE